MTSFYFDPRFPFLFLNSVSNNLSDLYFCVSDLIFSISSPFSPSFSPASFFFSYVLLLSSCVIFLGTYGPWHCHTLKFLSLFLLLLLLFLVALYCYDHHSKKKKMWTLKSCYFWTVNNLSYPWLPKCDVQSGSSSAVHADCALALINWCRSRRKEESLSLGNLWAQTCLLSMPFDPCAATHKIRKDEESRHWFHDIITGCSVLASFSNFEDLDSVNIFVFLLFSCCIWIDSEWEIFRWFCQCCKLNLGALRDTKRCHIVLDMISNTFIMP